MGSVVVLDLDETLLYACSKQDCKCDNDDPVLWQAVCNAAVNRCRNIEPRIDTLQSDSYFMFLRPHVVEFLRYCRAHFRIVVIFTAGNAAHARYIYNALFRDKAGVEVDFLLHRDSCGKSAAQGRAQKSAAEEKAMVLVPFQKNLSHLHEYVENKATPEQASKIDWNDCLFVDDLAMHAVNNCGETLLVPKYDYSCLAHLHNAQKNPTVLDRALHEAATDETLLLLTRFIHNKTTLQPRALWHQVDKRFALFH